MSVATKLEYLNDTKQLLKENINNLGGNLTNEPFRQYASVLEGIYESLPKVSGIGASLSLSPSMVGKIKLNEIQGDTYQQRYTGKNLLDLSSTQTSYGITSNYNSSTGLFSFSGTSTQGYSDLTNFISCNITAGTYTFSLNHTFNKNFHIILKYDDNSTSDFYILAGNTSKTFTTSKTAVSQKIYTATTNGTTYNESFYIQLEQSSTATSYEPYVGGIPSPNPSYPQTIQSVTGLQNVGVCGKNLINGLLDNSTTGKKLERTINADENFYLYIKTNNTKSDRCYAFLDNTNVGTIWVSNNNGTLTFSGSRNFTFNRIRIQDNTTVSENMLTLGSTSTTYEPYKGNTYEVNLGKQLFDKDNANVLNAYFNLQQGIISNDNTRSIYIPCKPNTTYTMQKNGSARFRIGTTDSVPIIGSSILNINSDDSASVLTITTPSNAKYLIAYIYGTFDTNPKTFDEVLDSIQIEVGSSSTSYSPYFTPIELNKTGDYEDSIKKSTGKNLFDKNTIIEGKYIDSNGNLSDDNNNFVGDYIEIDNTKSYYASQNAGGVIRIGYYNSSKTYISRQLINGNYGSLTIPNNTKYVRLSCYNTSLDTLQLEQNNQATSYEPYGKVWYITKNVGKKIVEDNSGWSKSSRSDVNRYYIYNYLSGGLEKKDISTLVCNYLNCISQNQADAGNLGLANLNGNGLMVQFALSDTDFDTLQKWKTFVGTYKPKVLYVLSTPIYEVITNTELINQLETLYNAKSKNGTTNINVTSEDLSMILNVGVLKGE